MPYHQTDLYTWPDGRIERNDFRGAYVNASRWIHERDGLIARTLINERQISDDWAVEDISEP